ncbi:MAG TPA: hypothetical protein VNZ86_07870 [Bacteroidia bacterium]|nr:hypothetical protein [Bacteroidia bacterium]
MKRIIPAILLLLLTCFTVKAQTEGVIGIITAVKPHFANTLVLVVENTELVLTKDPKDKTGKAFELKKKYKDLLLEKDGQYILNPKYAGKRFIIHYTVNGKGWKCIQTLNLERR